MEQPQIQNIMSTVDLGCQLNLSYIANHCPSTEYNPEKFNPVIMRLKKPKSTALIFTSGKIVVTGTKDEKITKHVARTYARIIQKLGFPVRFLNFRITNMVASCLVPFKLPLFDKYFLPSEKMKFVDYQPELFPGLIYRTDVTIILFKSGKLIITNGKSRQQILDAYKTFTESIHSRDPTPLDVV